MKCEYHSDKDEVTKCNMCGKPLCEDCKKIQDEFSACPECSKRYLKQVYLNYKHGLIYNILSLVCFVAFTVLYIVEVCLKNLKTLYIIFGAIIIAVLGSLSLYMFFNSLKKIKCYKSQLNSIENKNDDIVKKENKN